MTTKEFFDTWNDKVLTNYGYHQCVAVYNQYCIDVLGVKPIIVPNAVSIWNNYDVDEFDKVTNTTYNFPIEGDVVIWGTQIDQDGHVAISKGGDSATFTSFDQNYPLGSSCHFQAHDYTGVLGWLRPKSQEPMATITQKELDQLRHDRDQHYNDLQTEIGKNIDLQTKLTACLNRPPQVITHTITVPPTNINFTPDVPNNTPTNNGSWWSNFIHSLFG